jgi:hypothetical protein
MCYFLLLIMGQTFMYYEPKGVTLYLCEFVYLIYLLFTVPFLFCNVFVSLGCGLVSWLVTCLLYDK